MEIVAETVRVSVKNGAVVTKVLQVLRNPADTPVHAALKLPLSDKDTLVDLGVIRRSDSITPASHSSRPPVPLTAAPESADSASTDSSDSSSLRLAPGEVLSVFWAYQTALDGKDGNFRYLFPLRESWLTGKTIGSFAFFADIQEQTRIMEVRTEGYPIVVRGNGPKRQAYFWQDYFLPKKDIGFSYRLLPKGPE